MKKLRIGILGIQGDIEENSDAINEALKELQIEGSVIFLKNFTSVTEIDGLIIPGGESTVIGMLLFLQKVQLDLLKNKIQSGLPVLGTCAGLILLANKTYDKTVGETKQHLLEILDVTVERNAFGRQKDSFESKLNIPFLGEETFNGVFIRGPAITEIGEGVQILTKLDNKIVAVRQNNIIATSFHPELANDNRFHKSFLNMCLEYNNSKKN
jgi:pyridoxal 5'-phosphate synthase pdxT subunit